MVAFIPWLDALPAGRYRFWNESETGVLIIFYKRHDMKSDPFFSREVQDEIEVKDARDLGRSLFFHFPDILKILENFPVQTSVWI